MIEERAEFFSEGIPLAAIIRRADGGGGVTPAIVQGPGWLGLADAKLYLRYHEALTAAGFTVLIFDYRGFGDSGGDRGTLSPAAQLQDLINAVSYLESVAGVDGDAIGVFGSGGTGGGNAVLLAAVDPRIKAVVSQVPVADGADWLRRMRTPARWDEFQARLATDRRQRAVSGAGERVHPREEIMIPTQERRATSVKKDVDARIPTEVALSAADEILRYRPIDAARLISPRPLMVIAVDGDDVTPTDHATGLYEAAGAPKKLILQANTTHYAAYDQYGDRVIPQIVAWFEAAFTGAPLADEEVVEVGR